MTLSSPQSPKPPESELYGPVKALLEMQGYEVKGEIGAVDVVAVRGDEAPLIVELKSGFSLSLFHQAIARQAITDIVYIAVWRRSGRPFLKSLKNNISLCRRLGLGLITVRVKGQAEIHLDPAPYRPRKSPIRKSRLLKEFTQRVGDPNVGGSTRRTLITAYRQNALRCLQVLNEMGPTKASQVAKLAQVKRARVIMADNHYGWFERPERGIYNITHDGKKAMHSYKEELKKLNKTRGRSK